MDSGLRSWDLVETRGRGDDGNGNLSPSLDVVVDGVDSTKYLSGG